MLNDTEAWLGRLTLLVERFTHTGIGADIASLTMIELWALYLHLIRLAES